MECRDWPPALTRARFAYVLAPPVTDLIHGLKYEGWGELAGFMGRAMAGVLNRAFAEVRGPDRDRVTIVPVPTTQRRLRQRGYNQAGLLAVEVAGHVGSTAVDALTRSSAAASQTELAPWARHANVRGVFSCSAQGARRVSGTDVVLVDDVLTTGATAAEAACELAGAGARSVTLLAFARALPRVLARDAA